MSDDLAPKSDDTSHPDPVVGADEQHKVKENLYFLPTLASYYTEVRLKPALWLKALRTSDTKSFDKEDITAALGNLAAQDPELRRTFALAQSRSPSPAVLHWLAEATRVSLATRLAGVTIDPYAPAAEQLGRIADALSPQLRSKKKTERVTAENLLRLAARQLALQRELDPGEALRALFKPLRETSRRDSRLAARELGQRILVAGTSQLRDLTLAYIVSAERIAIADVDRREARERAAMMEADLRRVREQAGNLELALAAARESAAQTEAEITRLQQVIKDGRQVGAHGMADIMARFRSVIAGRIEPLLSDGADALEVEPAPLEVAKDRIEAARAIMKREIAWLEESSD